MAHSSSWLDGDLERKPVIIRVQSVFWSGWAQSAGGGAARQLRRPFPLVDDAETVRHSVVKVGLIAAWQRLKTSGGVQCRNLPSTRSLLTCFLSWARQKALPGVVEQYPGFQSR